MQRMLGKNKVFETTDPSREVWGQFNGLMSDSFLVNLNELSKKDTHESMGEIKGLITDGSLTINNKGVNQYKITSYHRFIITTNNNKPDLHSLQTSKKMPFLNNNIQLLLLVVIFIIML